MNDLERRHLEDTVQNLIQELCRQFPGVRSVAILLDYVSLQDRLDLRSSCYGNALGALNVMSSLEDGVENMLGAVHRFRRELDKMLTDYCRQQEDGLHSVLESTRREVTDAKRELLKLQREIQQRQQELAAFPGAIPEKAAGPRPPTEESGGHQDAS